jgi:hypothetical protein
MKPEQALHCSVARSGFTRCEFRHG